MRGGAVDIVSVAEPRSAYSNVCYETSLYVCSERIIEFLKTVCEQWKVGKTRENMTKNMNSDELAVGTARTGLNMR